MFSVSKPYRTKFDGSDPRNCNTRLPTLVRPKEFGTSDGIDVNGWYIEGLASGPTSKSEFSTAQAPPGVLEAKNDSHVSHIVKVFRIHEVTEGFRLGVQDILDLVELNDASRHWPLRESRNIRRVTIPKLFEPPLRASQRSGSGCELMGA